MYCLKNSFIYIYWRNVDHVKGIKYEWTKTERDFDLTALAMEYFSGTNNN